MLEFWKKNKNRPHFAKDRRRMNLQVDEIHFLSILFFVKSGRRFFNWRLFFDFSNFLYSESVAVFYSTKAICRIVLCIPNFLHCRIWSFSRQALLFPLNFPKFQAFFSRYNAKLHHSLHNTCYTSPRMLIPALCLTKRYFCIGRRNNFIKF